MYMVNMYIPAHDDVQIDSNSFPSSLLECNGHQTGSEVSCLKFGSRLSHIPYKYNYVQVCMVTMLHAA